MHRCLQRLERVLGVERQNGMYDYVTKVMEQDGLSDYVSGVMDALKDAFGEQADIEFDDLTGSGRVWFVLIEDHDADGYRASLDGWIGDNTVLSEPTLSALIMSIKSNKRFNDASSGFICGLEILREELLEHEIYVDGEIYQSDSWHEWGFELFSQDVRIGSFGLSSQKGYLELWFKRADLDDSICEASFPDLIPKIVEQLHH